MDIYGPEFEFSGEPVGLFEDGVCPNSDGLFRYEPYRGPGHLHMQELLRKSGTAQCHYVHAGEKVSFVVIGCPEHGVLHLSSFSVVSA